MIAASSLLALVGLSDLLHSRELHVPLPLRAPSAVLPGGRWRKVVLLGAAVVVTALAGISSPWWAVLGLLCGYALWLLSYRTQALGMVSTAVVTLALLTPTVLSGPLPADWVLTWGHGPEVWEVYEWGLLLSAIVLINLATANRVVRIVLRFTSAAPPVPIEPEPPEGAAGSGVAPRAGRVIGVLERYLIIALITAGQGLAIAGVAAAKSIIRYPEISQTAREGEGLSAEVFFIGTTTSWLFALGSTGLLLLAVR